LEVYNMKTVKSLLLGAAAGFVALSGAQAADLPGKAAPAEYVRICDTYGAGFFFIPGSDTCLRVGGFVRADYSIYDHTSRASSAGAGTAQNLNNGAFDNTTAFQSRVALNFDARSNTEYGLLRAFAQYTIRRGESSGYVGSGLNAGNNNPRSTLAVLDRAFIQFAGFTFGYSASFYNFYQSDVSLVGDVFVARAAATNLLAYTASFGSGFSATISLEDRRTSEIGNLDQFAAAATPPLVTLSQRPFSGLGGLTYGRQDVPDIVANLRVDQGWGSAQLMGALRQIRDFGYAGATSATSGANAPTAAAGDKFGFAIGAGLRINLDMLARGDVLWMQATYVDGALGYLLNNANSDGLISNRNSTAGVYNYSQASNVVFNYRDAIVNTGAGNVIQTTKAWGLAAGFRHFWTPALRSSIYGNYVKVDAPLASTLPDFTAWSVGVNTIWSPVRNLDLGVEIVYGQIRRDGFNAGTNAGTGALVRTDGTIKTSDSNWRGLFRVQRNF
jgi:hypothetical protein